MECHHVYILASKRRGALFVGCTDDLKAEVLEHKCNSINGVTRQFAIHQLVYFERFDNRGNALMREKEIKAMHRIWKLELVDHFNPRWRDMYDEFTGSGVRTDRVAG